MSLRHAPKQKSRQRFARCEKPLEQRQLEAQAKRLVDGSRQRALAFDATSVSRTAALSVLTQLIVAWHTEVNQVPDKGEVLLLQSRPRPRLQRHTCTHTLHTRSRSRWQLVLAPPRPRRGAKAGNGQ